MEPDRVNTKRLASGAALLSSPWLAALLRYFGVLGDAKDIGELIAGMPAEFIFMIAEWLAATAGLVLVFVSFSRPLESLLGRLGEKRRKRRRVREIFSLIPKRDLDHLRVLATGKTLVFKHDPRPPLCELLVQIAPVRIGEDTMTAWKLDPDFRKLVRRLLEEHDQA